jgi:hypothetical protein
MGSPLGNILAGSLVAVIGAVLLLVPSIGGVATWKVVLGVLGLALFIAAGRDRSARRE